MRRPDMVQNVQSVCFGLNPAGPSRRTRAYRSTALAGLMRSMMMTCWFLCVADVRVMPSMEPGGLQISTRIGPDPLFTVSVERRDRNTMQFRISLSSLVLKRYSDYFSRINVFLNLAFVNR